ncbi:Exodeoxyribonuclease I [Vibrio nigripulchritudo SFn27]|uniref:Exodeoxyribonuclease I n=1 Tax=Vibrio nigripulchritudo TaxID=28173 RepID=U4K4N5_9VIBR|nr:exodeoxyribonuclease I [Vibrio nigripulchritudo]CCN85716.1 Exodeoxyribonuclease I [Vibrio nigripulchritudo BLFn1]CCN86694.1 Exodeoxyribonuclease I [Vibrio nigripulchritudo SFn27]CCN95980.1 Exodeoxyribonuclease I [Vibrio nigripulchritudo ENn2]CCO43311.1 Exodeoxyribonuclease I [Vibrio nigripulchritudo SFn135]CCO53694.1 Exodeoxyribonuclease I [Vibrio nigripulchritudo Wn13]
MSKENQPTLFFFDYETWGTSPAKDRPSQFAGVRTDMDLNIIGEPLVIYCQPPSDYLPSPEAALITGISPQTAVSKGLPEPEFIKKIHDELSTPNTTSLGYNSIRFDDEVSRYTLYRNFYDPYAWSWQHGNSRWDLLDVMRACHALRPEGVNWPQRDDGYTSFKLEHLSVANGIEHENAHDAMADVIATIEMAKKVKEAQPKLFDYLFSMRHKKKLNELVDIVNMTPLMHVSGMLGAECSYTSWMVPVAWHPTNQNAVVMVNLAMDPSPLIELDSAQLKERLYTRRDQLSEGELPVPIKLVHLNKCPVLAPAKTLSAENAETIGIDREQCLKNLAVIRQHPEIREKLIELYQNQNEYDVDPDVDTQLYNGFFSPADKTAMEIIREKSPEQLAGLDLNVKDARIAPLLFRYRARHYPWTLDETEQAKWAAHCREYFESNLPEYMQNLENLVHEHDGDEKKIALLKSVYHYVEKLVS